MHCPRPSSLLAFGNQSWEVGGSKDKKNLSKFVINCVVFDVKTYNAATKNLILLSVKELVGKIPQTKMTPIEA